MKGQAKAHVFERFAGVVTWAIVSGIALMIMRHAAGRYEGLVGATVALQLLNLLGMLGAGSDFDLSIAPTLRRLAFAVQLASALLMGWLLPIDFLPIYTIIWLAMAPHFFSRRNCYFAFAALLLAWYVIQTVSWQDKDAIVAVLLFGTFHFFALLSSTERIRAERAREQAQALNRELVATQHLLTEASKQNERTRIARDLHDLLGHHLTALTINLQVAGRMTEDGRGKEKIEQCYALSKLLLSDVREAVTTLREQAALDFTQALKLIVANIPRLEIHLDIDDDLNIDDVNVAESLLRCVQEAITNTLRHSQASTIWIAVSRSAGRLQVEIRDNGRVAAPLRWGNGLTGMRERVERIDGELVVDKVHQALRINIQIPVT